MAFQIQNKWTLLRYLVFACGRTNNVSTRLGRRKKSNKTFRSSRNEDEDFLEEGELTSTSRSSSTSKKKSSRILQRMFRRHKNHGATSDYLSYSKNRRKKADPSDWGLEEHSVTSGDRNQRFLLRDVVSFPRRSSNSKKEHCARTDCQVDTGTGTVSETQSQHSRDDPSCHQETLYTTSVLSRCRNKPSKSILERALQDECSAADWQALLQDFMSYTATHRNRTTGVIPYFKATRFALDLNKAHLLDKILPFVECLECRPTTYTSEGLRYLLNCLARHRKNAVSSPVSPSSRKHTSTRHQYPQYHLKELKLLHLPSRLFSKDHQLCRSLTAMLQAGGEGDVWSCGSTAFKKTTTTVEDSVSTPRLKVCISLEQNGSNPYHITNPFAGASKTPDDSACFQAIQEAFDATTASLSLSESMDAASSNPIDAANNAGEKVEYLELVDFFVPAVEFQRFLANPCNPKTVSIRRFRLSGSLRVRQPRQHLEQTSIYLDDTFGDASIDCSRSSIEDLAMTGCALAFDCVDSVVHSIASLPDLKRLTCSVWKHVPAILLRLHYRQQLAPQEYHAEYTYETLDFTEGLLMMLDRGKIESIASMTAHVQVSRICPALATNKSLKIMNLMSSSCLARRANQPCWTVEDEACLLQVLTGSREEYEVTDNGADLDDVGGNTTIGGNTTLEDLSRVSCPRLRYHMALNRCGRTQARDERHTTVESFVGLLEQVNSSTTANTYSRLFGVDDQPPIVRPAKKPLQVTGRQEDTGAADLYEDACKDLTKQQVLYGLLIENPDLWCRCHNG